MIPWYWALIALQVGIIVGMVIIICPVFLTGRKRRGASTSV